MIHFASSPGVRLDIPAHTPTSVRPYFPYLVGREVGVHVWVDELGERHEGHAHELRGGLDGARLAVDGHAEDGGEGDEEPVGEHVVVQQPWLW